MPTMPTFCRAATRRFLPTVLLCGFSFGGAIANDKPSADSTEQVQQIDAATRRIEIRENDVLLLEYPDWLTTVKSFDPTVIRVSAVRPNCLRVRRVSQGTTTLQAVDRGDHRYSIQVIVRASSDGR